MKFQPSKATAAPIQGYSNACYHDNKYIPSASVRDLEVRFSNDHTNEEKDNEIHGEDDGNGRIIRYDTITMTSPVLSSARLVKRTPTRYITDNEVHELNDKLQSLFLNTRNDEKEEENDEDETNSKSPGSKKHSKSKILAVELTKRDQATTTYFGRCSLIVYNSMTNNFVEVVRSARLALTSS